MTEIKVLKRHQITPEHEKGESVGRGSPLRNPWPVNGGAGLTIQQVQDRYWAWMKRNIEVEDPDVMRELNRLADVLETRDLILIEESGDYHGHIIKAVLEGSSEE